MHRDIKPENLLLDVSGNIRISDFGAAHTEPDPIPLDPSEVYAHEVTGTWAYMAPEMLFNRKPKSRVESYGLAVDYWSLGCVAFELVAEEPNVRAIDSSLIFHLTRSYQSLFDSEEELRRYQSWHQTEHSKSYLSFAGLSEDVESLVSGVRIIPRFYTFVLTRPQLLALDPLKRYRIDHLRYHPYFQHYDGFVLCYFHLLLGLPCVQDI